MSDQMSRPEGPDPGKSGNAGGSHAYGPGPAGSSGTAPGTGPAPVPDGPAPQGPYPPPPGYAQPDYAYQARPKSGLAVTALVLGIATVVISLAPVIGFISFILGLLALVFGIVALVQRQKKSLAVTGMVLGVVGMIIAGIWLAFLTYFIGRTVGDHTVRYQVSTTAPATVTYFDGSQTVSRQVSGTWQDQFSYHGLPIGAVSVVVPGGQASCEVFLDGKSLSHNNGAGRVECVTADVGDQGKH
jgi:hypothetical protein